MSDIDGSYAKDAIMELVNKGIINGKGDGKFEIADYAFQWVRSGVSPSNLLIPSLLKANLSKPHPKNGPLAVLFFYTNKFPPTNLSKI
ncbi:S-layer homology domain-containing protein [Paenibacillus phoenicis]|uniref:S-layer homology domain-containing protein n=1 Tax=Paenibacillus phoenicis TaxID=554117 RepID=A0ABU5PNU8_9BACL|nr:S-layer homology domain-containing protein [Paenibacillus phoenicis]MEA3571585.1 S-layer homology domain-containing protein [Paenibacillus phoenicis]